jgi:hypothetical protein
MLLSLLRFKAAHKRRKRNRPYPIGLCPKWCSKRTQQKSTSTLCPLLKAQCRLNLANAQQQYSILLKEKV